MREITPPQPEYGNLTSQGVQAHLSEAWNQAGYSGQGVKVGIIDIGFKDLTSLMGTELPATVQAKCYTDIGVFTQDLADCEAVDDVTTSLRNASTMLGTWPPEAPTMARLLLSQSLTLPRR